MGIYKVMLYIHYNRHYSLGTNNSVIWVDVNSNDPYDKQSKRFKKYTHKIDYPRGDYKPQEYIIYIFDDNAFYYSYIFAYYNPSKKVISVDLFFPYNDKGNKNPLVIGINEKDGGTTYYTYNHLSKSTSTGFSYRPTHDNLPTAGKFDSEDLLTRLTEELGLLGYDRRDKLLVELDRRPAEGVSVTYPKTGPNSGKITVSKQTHQENEKTISNELSNYFDKYVHNMTIKTTHSGFFMSLGRNTVFLDADSIYKLRALENVDVYYSKTNTEKFLIVVLKFKDKTKWFTQTEFQDFLTKKNANVNISSFKNLDIKNLFDDLKKENDKIDENVIYCVERTKKYSYKIEFKSEQDDSSSKEFIKCVHKPQNKYGGKICSVLYKGNPLMRKGDKIEPIEELKNQIFSSIVVYFSIKNPNVPLIIELTKSDEDTTLYYKRKEEGEVEYWEKDEKIKKDNTSELQKKLKEEESNLFTTVALLIDKSNKYKKEEVKESLSFELTEAQPEEINVKLDETCSVLKNNNFKSYQHEISIDKSKSFNKVRLKLFVFNGTEIKIYDKGELTYLYYDKNENNKVVAYFYGGDSRPLLLSYNNKFYRPKDKDNYPIDWVCVEGVSRCDGSSDQQLLDTLNEVTYFMNRVNINESIDKNKRTDTYTTHTFNTSSKVQIRLESKEMDCFKEYVHITASSYPLGEIFHQGYKLFNSFKEYKTQIGGFVKFPEKVYTYYYLYDGGHDFPLLVKLEFKGSSSNGIRKYFKLTDKVDYEWTKVDNTLRLNDNKELEKLLREIKDNLSINCEKKDENLIISTSDRCKEGNVAGPVAGVLMTLSLLGGGAAGVAYKYPDFFPSIYNRIL